MKKTFLTLLSAAALAVSAAPAVPSPAPAPAAPARPAVPVPPMLKMTLPEVIYAVPGIESNIYFENVVDTAVYRNYAYEVRCLRGAQGEHRWFWTPTEKDAGKSFDLELRLFNDYGMVVSAKCKVVVAGPAADPKQKFTLALLAASGVNCGYPAHLLGVMREKGFANYTPIGSHAGGGKPVVPGGVAHDGYGGFSWNSFLTRWAYSFEELPGPQNKAEEEQMRALGVTKLPKSQAYRLRSPLLRLKDGKPVLDIPAWLNKINGGKAPDYIVIQLGGNDMFGARPEQLDEKVAKVMENARTLLGELRKHAPQAVIGVATEPCGCGQDGFGANYGCAQSKYQFRRNAQRYNRELDALIKGLKDPRIVILPLHQSIDPENSFLTGSFKAHARSEKKVKRDRNALHASMEGGRQFGDAIASWLIKQREK